MMQCSSEKFGSMWRGVIRRGNEYRYTRQAFHDDIAAELYVLAVVLRLRSIYG